MKNEKKRPKIPENVKQIKDQPYSPFTRVPFQLISAADAEYLRGIPAPLKIMYKVEIEEEKMKNDTIMNHYKHIDNGGVTVSIEDRGVKHGIILTIGAEYHGYPGIISQINIEQLGPEWLKELGVKLIEAAGSISKIDFEERYNEPRSTMEKIQTPIGPKTIIKDKTGKVIASQG